MAFAISLRRPRSTNAALELTETSVSEQTKLNLETNIKRHQLTGWGRNGEEKVIDIIVAVAQMRFFKV